MSNRINWIDWAKVLTMILVVLGHFDFKNDNIIYQNFIYSFHMPLFFLLSGYLHKQSDDFRSYLSKNIKSLVIPYILLNLSVFLILLPYYIDSNTDIKELLFNFIICERNIPAGACWFLLSLFFVKIFTFYILRLNRYLRIILIIFLPILCFLFAQKLRINIYLSVDSAMMAIPFYIAGYYLKKHQVTETVKNNHTHAFLFTLSLSALIIGNYINGRIGIYSCFFGNYLILFYINSFMGCIMAICFCKLFDRVGLNFIRRISSGLLVILAYHLPLIAIISKMYIKIFKTQPNILSNLIISIIIILLLYYPIIIIQKYCPILIGNRDIK